MAVQAAECQLACSDLLLGSLPKPASPAMLASSLLFRHTLQSQGLCMCCFLCRECAPSLLHGSSSERSYLGSLSKIDPLPLFAPKLFIFIYSTYQHLPQYIYYICYFLECNFLENKDFMLLSCIPST